jgi:Flp pilus assembly protein TadG
MRQAMTNRRSNPRRRRASRLGAVAVEFACVAPLLLAVVVGLTEVSRVYTVQNTLESAAREGARFASLDRTGMIQEGGSANSKLEADVKGHLAAAGLDPDKIAVNVVAADDPEQTFNLDDPENDLKLFQVRVELPYSEVSYSPVSETNDYSLSAALTFRNGRAPSSE